MRRAGRLQGAPGAENRRARPVQLPAELARVREPQGQDFVAGDRDLVCAQPRERRVAEVRIGAGGEDVARARPAQRERVPRRRAVGDRRLAARARDAQEIDEALLEERRAGEVEALLRQPRDRGLQLDPAAPRQQVRERDAAGLRREPVRNQPVEHAGRVRTRDLDLGECRDVHDAGALAHRAHLGADDVVQARAAKAVDVLRLGALGREPLRALVAVDLLEDRALGLEVVVER